MQLNFGRERNNSNFLRRNSSYYCNAHSILDKLPLLRGAWQQGKADTAPTMTCVMYTVQVTNIGVTAYDKVGSSYQHSVF